MIEVSDLRFVFVVTYARSGSTLLQSLLNACPDVQIRGENSNTLFHMYKAGQAVEATRVFGRHPQTRQVDEPWFGSFKVRPKLFEAGLINNFVRNVLAPDDGVKVTGFKEVRYTRHFIPKPDFAPYMDFLLAKFPNAKLVFNTRPAADVAKSAFHANHRPDQIMVWVAEADENFAAYNATSDRTILMRYQDYTRDHSLVHRMLDFLDLDWKAERVEQVFAKPLAHAKAAVPKT
ncbi:MAG: sulfotransferase [Alphaproteobacteria bacterium]